jgi:hypothetical protein
MPKISDDVIRAVTEAAKIEDVVGEVVTLRRSGVNMTGICPFHDDTHDGNFIVRPSTIKAENHGNTYRCFVCDSKGGPVQFLMNAEHMTFPDAIRYLGKKYNIPVDDVPVNWTPPPPKPTPPPPPPLEIARSWVSKTMRVDYNRNIFTYWFMLLPWSDEQRARIKQTLWQYCVGGWADGRVVFWQIDHTGIPRTAKLMKFYPQYHPKFGHRDKDSHPGWIHNQPGCREVCEPDKHTILKPLFGAHLLKRYPQAVVNVVESEKTALVMANYYGHSEQQLWLACGGLKFLQLDSMQPLIDQGRQVWLWPDRDGVIDWQKVADKLGSEKVQVYTRFFDTCWREEDGQKADAADIAIRMMKTGDKPRQAPEQSATAKSHETVLPLGADLPLEPVEWNSDEPFIDTDELVDPRLRLWRETLRKRYNFNKTRNNGRTIQREVCDAGDEGEQALGGAAGEDSQEERADYLRVDTDGLRHADSLH